MTVCAQGWKPAFPPTFQATWKLAASQPTGATLPHGRTQLCHLESLLRGRCRALCHGQSCAWGPPSMGFLATCPFPNSPWKLREKQASPRLRHEASLTSKSSDFPPLLDLYLNNYSSTLLKRELRPSEQSRDNIC